MNSAKVSSTFWENNLWKKIQIGQEFTFKLNITCFYYEFSHYYFDKISYKCKKHKCLNCYFTILQVSQIYRFKICIIIFCFLNMCLII